MRMVNGFKCRNCLETFFKLKKKEAINHLREIHDLSEDQIPPKIQYLSS